MLFYFHFFYSFPFNVISVATVLCFCGFHPPVVSTFPWFPPCVVTLWFAPSCCLHLPVVTPWCPFHGLHFRGLHSAVVSTLPWFPPSLWLLRGVPFWFALSWFTLCPCGSHPLCGYSWCPFRGLHHHMVYTLLWFPPSHGLHLCVVPTLPVVTSVVSLSWFAPSRGLHSAVVSTLPWFASSRGSHPLMVTLWCPSWILA